jgi:hypothetical protein
LQGLTLNPFPEETTNPDVLDNAPKGIEVSPINDAQVY